MRYRERDGTLRRESTFADDWQGAQKKLRERLQARDGNILQIVRQGESLLFGKWTEFFMENYSKPPFRTIKTHVANLRAVKHLNRTFATRTLASLTADDIELYLRDRLRQRIRIKTRLGYREGRRMVKPTTVHQELRVLRRMLNVAVRKRLIPSNPCSGVEFPAAVPYFRIYDLRSTYATRLSAGGVADEWVTQLLRQGDAQVFKKYSQMKLQMQREALKKINRHANEMPESAAVPVPEFGNSGTVLAQ